MLAGAKYRGEFEDRLKAVLKEIKESNSQTIMFIDERHTVVGAVAAEGSVDASNMLKPALARGELRCIGATTINEFRKYIEKDAALERRFQPVMVKSPPLRTPYQSCAVLKKDMRSTMVSALKTLLLWLQQHLHTGISPTVFFRIRLLI